MTDDKITVIAKVKAKDGFEETVAKELLSLVEPTRHEPGCMTYILHQASDDKAIFMFYEVWRSKKALDEHLQKPYLTAFVAKADELLAQPLDVTIWEKIS